MAEGRRDIWIAECDGYRVGTLTIEWLADDRSLADGVAIAHVSNLVAPPVLPAPRHRAGPSRVSRTRRALKAYRSMTIGVDEGNHYARTIYERRGYRWSRPPCTGGTAFTILAATPRARLRSRPDARELVRTIVRGLPASTSSDELARSLRPRRPATGSRVSVALQTATGVRRRLHEQATCRPARLRNPRHTACPDQTWKQIEERSHIVRLVQHVGRHDRVVRAGTQQQCGACSRPPVCEEWAHRRPWPPCRNALNRAGNASASGQTSTSTRRAPTPARAIAAMPRPDTELKHSLPTKRCRISDDRLARRSHSPTASPSRA
jgi:hypothetical protein